MQRTTYLFTHQHLHNQSSIMAEQDKINNDTIDTDFENENEKEKKEEKEKE